MDNQNEHSHPNYVKIWALLLLLLVISIVGPMFGIKWVLLITAFGIAFVKALIVAAYFMHLNVEKKLIWYLLLACVAFLLILFTFVAPDVMNHSGTNWEKIDPKTTSSTQAESGAHH